MDNALSELAPGFAHFGGMIDRDSLQSFLSAPRVWGAAIFVACTGAITGMAVGSSPMVERGIGAELPDRAPVQQTFADARLNRSGPDHYPLVTPEGTIPVSELAYHGRLRNQRASWNYGEPDYVLLEADYEDDYYTSEEVDQLAATPAYQQDPQAAGGSAAIQPQPTIRTSKVRVIRGGDVGLDVQDVHAARAEAERSTAIQNTPPAQAPVQAVSQAAPAAS